MARATPGEEEREADGGQGEGKRKGVAAEHGGWGFCLVADGLERVLERESVRERLSMKFKILPF